MLTALAAAVTILTGHFEVTDGDTIRLGSERVRLVGIDAPEMSQLCGSVKCGQTARGWLIRFIADRPVHCEGKERDRYRRLLATCTVGGEDIGRALVRAGMAVAYVKYSKVYADDERAARESRVGLWAVGLTSPEAFRRKK